MVPFQIEGLLSANMNSLVFFLQLKTRLQVTLAATLLAQTQNVSCSFSIGIDLVYQTKYITPTKYQADTSYGAAWD
jgi:hypothetical protein